MCLFEIAVALIWVMCRVSADDCTNLAQAFYAVACRHAVVKRKPDKNGTFHESFPLFGLFLRLL